MAISERQRVAHRPPLLRWLANRTVQGYLLGLATALVWGVTAVLNRVGLGWYGSPLAGSLIGLTVATLVMFLGNVRRVRTANYGGRRAVLFLLLAGVAAGIGSSANYVALHHAPVVIAQPLTAVSPLLTILLAYLIIPAERITWRVVVGACLVVTGVILIGLSLA